MIEEWSPFNVLKNILTKAISQLNLPFEGGGGVVGLKWYKMVFGVFLSLVHSWGRHSYSSISSLKKKKNRQINLIPW